MTTKRTRQATVAAATVKFRPVRFPSRASEGRVKTVTGFSLDPELIQWLREYAQEQGVSASALVEGTLGAFRQTVESSGEKNAEG